MIVLYSKDIQSIAFELVATVGFFDGVHLGHRFLIESVNRKAKEQNRKSAVITFLTHPRKVLDADFQPLLITTFDEKLKLLASTGVDYCIVLNFDLAMSRLAAFDFLKQLVYEQFNVKALLIGHDHKFGHNRSEGFSDYQQYGERIGLEIIQTTRFSTDMNKHISSSEVRNALQTANVFKAHQLLGYQYALVGIVAMGFKIGRKLGFPTANLQVLDPEKMIPASAVYAVRVLVDSVWYGGMMNIGIRPTLNKDLKTSLEVHIFDYENDIYDQQIKVEFLAKIRNEQRFNSLDDLIQQLHLDKISALQLIDLQQ